MDYFIHNHYPSLSGRVPCPWACCFLMPTATAGCSCRWREYAVDAVECVSCSQGWQVENVKALSTRQPGRSECSPFLATLQAVCPLLWLVPDHGGSHTAFTFPRGLRKARERGRTFVEGRPHHTPRGPGTRQTALVTDTALILTRRAGQVCSAVTSSDFGRSVM